MRKLLTAGIFGTILTLTGSGAANASIVSSGFLDEKLTEYALSTALDLKANQSDLTALNDIVGKQIWDIVLNLKVGNFPHLKELFPGLAPDKRVPFVDLAGYVLSNYDDHGAPNLASVADKFLYGWTNSDKLTRQGLIALNDGWTDKNNGATYLGVKDLNTKTGSYYWGPENKEYKFSNIPYFKEFFPDISPDKSIAMSDMATTILLNYTNVEFPGLAGVTNKLLNGWTDAKGGIINPGLKGMYDGWTQDDRYLPGLKMISDYVSRVEDAYKARFPIVFTLGSPSTTIDGVDYTGPVYPLWKLSEGIDKIDSIETKIGELPDGKTVAGMIKETDGKIGKLPTEIPNIDSTWARYGFVDISGTPIDLPDTVGGMLSMLFNEDGKFTGLSLRNIMAKILMGFVTNTGARIEGLSYLTNAYNLQGDSPLVNAVNANTAKIGTLPSEYSTVGAALTAIKGIAEEAKAAALAAIPDPKQEGSSGKFVLTVDIVGDNATYRWEKIDREGETTTISE